MAGVTRHEQIRQIHIPITWIHNPTFLGVTFFLFGLNVNLHLFFCHAFLDGIGNHTCSVECYRTLGSVYLNHDPITQNAPAVTDGDHEAFLFKLHHLQLPPLRLIQLIWKGTSIYTITIQEDMALNIQYLINKCTTHISQINHK